MSGVGDQQPGDAAGHPADSPTHVGGLDVDGQPGVELPERDGDSNAASDEVNQGDVAQVAVGTAFEAGLASALGGVRGLIDSGVPSLVFVLDYLLRGKRLGEAVASAVVASLLITGLRLVRKEPVKQALSGLLGVAFSAGLAYFTGQARNYFVTGIALNAVYGTALLVSIIVRRPALGYISAALAGDIQWRTHPLVRRKMFHATWLWVGVFYLRIGLQLPLYLNDSLATLGIMKIALGWPLYLLAAGATWMYLRPHRTGVAAQPDVRR